jgi:hypothetical protein
MNEGKITDYPLYPGVLSCFGYAWNVLRKKFLEFFLIAVIGILLTIPNAGMSSWDEVPWFFAVQFFAFSLIYFVFLYRPLEYGIYYAFLKGARGDDVEVSDILYVFKNYLNALFAHILVGFIIGIGIMFCFIPGILFACKLAFVPYLIVDKKMNVIEAIKESWRLTTGHAVTVFLIGLTSIPIYVAGLMLCFIGVVFSAMWVDMTFASLYYAVTRSEQSEQGSESQPVVRTESS